MMNWETIYTTLTGFNIYSCIFRLLLATIGSALIGLDRERRGRAAGLRTHILVCVGSTLIALTSCYISEAYEISGDITRLSAQVISGIGFLGAGTILIRNRSIVTGLTTAAGLWATACIGIAIGFGFYLGAIIGMALCFITVWLLEIAEIKHRNPLQLYIELDNIAAATTATRQIRQFYPKMYNLDLIAPKSGAQGHAGILLRIDMDKDSTEEAVVQNLVSLEHVILVLTL